MRYEELTKNEILERITPLYSEVKEIKGRCKGVSASQMEVVTKIVKLYNAYTKRQDLKATPCSIDYTLSLVKRLLEGTGRIERS